MKRIVCLDFDNTITAEGHTCYLPPRLKHLPKRLGGQKPLSELLRDVAVYRGKTKGLGVLVDTLLYLYPKDYHQRLISAMGGPQRVAQLTRFFQRIDPSRYYLVSSSWYPFNAAQWRHYLQFVMELFQWPHHLSHIKTLAKKTKHQTLDKGRVIQRLLHQKKLAYQDCLFYDDSLDNILTAKSICLTRWLIQAKLQRNDLRDIQLFLNSGAG